MNHKKIGIILLISFLFLAFVFAFGDFDFSNSITTSDYQSDKIMTEDYVLEEDEIFLYIGDTGMFGESFKQDIERVINMRGIATMLINDLSEAEGPVMGIYIDVEDHMYTPIACDYSINLTMGFSSYGDTAYFEDWSEGKSPFIETSSEGIVYHCRMSIKDETKGVISYKSYKRLMTESIVTGINTIVPPEII